VAPEEEYKKMPTPQEKPTKPKQDPLARVNSQVVAKQEAERNEKKRGGWGAQVNPVNPT